MAGLCCINVVCVLPDFSFSLDCCKVGRIGDACRSSTIQVDAC